MENNMEGSNQQKGISTLTILLIILVLVIIAGGIWYWYTNKSTPTTTPTTTTQTTPTTPTTTTQPTTETKKTYQSKIGKYSIILPDKATALSKGEGEGRQIEEIDLLSPIKSSDYIYGSSGLKIRVLLEEQGDLNTYIKDLKLDQNVSCKKDSIRVSGISASRYTCPDEFGATGDIVYILFSNNGVIYHIEDNSILRTNSSVASGDVKGWLNDILSTFQFTP